MKKIALPLLLVFSAGSHAAYIFTFEATVDFARADYPSTIPEPDRTYPVVVGDKFQFRVLYDENKPGGRTVRAWEDPNNIYPIYQAPNYPIPATDLHYIQYDLSSGNFYTELLEYSSFGEFKWDPYQVSSLVGTTSLESSKYTQSVLRPFILQDQGHTFSEWLNGNENITFSANLQHAIYTTPMYLNGSVNIVSISEVPILPSALLYGLAILGLAGIKSRDQST